MSRMTWCCACNSKALLAPDSKGVSFVLLFFEFGGGGNVNVGHSVMVNIHAVHYSVLTQSDTELVTEILNLEFIQLIHTFFFYSLRQ